MIWRFFFVRVYFSCFQSTLCTVGKNEKCSLTKKIFRQCQINSLVTYLVKSLLSRNFCQKCVRENSRNFHTVLWKLRNFTVTIFSQKFRQLNFLLKKIFYEINVWKKAVFTFSGKFDFTEFLHGREIIEKIICADSRNISWNQCAKVDFTESLLLE